MNIADLIEENSRNFPDKPAVKAPRRSWGKYRYDQISFKEFLERSDKYAKGLHDSGLKKGMKVLMFVRPGLDFPVLTFSLFKLGLVPIFIDPGMGKKNLLKAICDVKPEGLIAETTVHLISKFNKAEFSSVKYSFTVGSFPISGVKRIKDFLTVESAKMNVEIDKDDLAAILFTSGGTGVPKGVEYTHSIFLEQTKLLQKMFDLSSKEVDIPGFPLFALFTLAMGMTSCIPDMNPSKPAKANPKRLVQNIIDNQGSFVAGSPAIWSNVALYCTEKNIQLPSVKYLVMFGAPVRPEIHEQFKWILPNGSTYTPYGATECLPVSCTSGKVLQGGPLELMRQGKGTCIGMPAPSVKVEIIQISDSPIENIKDVKVLPVGEIGEITVTGPTVTKAYFGMPDKTKEAKIYDGETVWHRMGDLGYKDKFGNLWFCGRKTHRVATPDRILSSVQCEAIFNNHPFVKRSALIGIGNSGDQKPAIVIEPKSGLKLKVLKNELKLLASAHPLTKGIEDIYFENNFPVDVRHNIKIDRLKLRDMALAGQLQ